ncbi:MAG: HD domain-containing protein [Myxococcales bacterium FL481]|nr:MAG: HD domain-containing protein [Myxococcales bacterium FL481]
MTARSLPLPSLAEQLLVPAIEVGRRGIAPTPSLLQTVRGHAPMIRELDPARLYQQLEAAICGHYPHLALQWIRDAGLLVEILPELDATVAFSQEGGRRHKDVWEHTKTVVQQAVPRPVVRWSAMLHDIGKVPTRRFTSSGKVTFLGHAEVGARMFRRSVAKRIAFPKPIAKRIELLILHHLRGGQYDGSWTDSAVRRFGRDMAPFLDELLLLSRADITSRRPGKRKQCLRNISELAARIRELSREDTKVKPLPAGLGHALMQAFQLPPGKHLADVRERLSQAYEAGDLEPGRDFDYYVDFVRRHDLLAGIEVRTPRTSRGA